MAVDFDMVLKIISYIKMTIEMVRKSFHYSYISH